jgi:hypothetical protein
VDNRRVGRIKILRFREQARISGKCIVHQASNAIQEEENGQFVPGVLALDCKANDSGIIRPAL